MDAPAASPCPRDGRTAASCRPGRRRPVAAEAAAHPEAADAAEGAETADAARVETRSREAGAGQRAVPIHGAGLTGRGTGPTRPIRRAPAPRWNHAPGGG